MDALKDLKSMNSLYITGAGVSADSAIPTFRGRDGFWTVGSVNYTPQEMATRSMYQSKPAEFLKWYYHRFATYRNHGPNPVHHWLADKNLITQNIDGLDAKAGNQDYIAIHGRLDQMTRYHHQGDEVEILATPWDQVDKANIEQSLLELFKIDRQPKIGTSYKPFILLFDEYYTQLYRVNEAQQQMQQADKMIFIGTSFSVNITQIALKVASNNNIPIEIVDPDLIEIPYSKVTYHRMKASEFIQL